MLVDAAAQLAGTGPGCTASVQLQFNSMQSLLPTWHAIAAATTMNIMQYMCLSKMVSAYETAAPAADVSGY
jgi:hypothetical protein